MTEPEETPPRKRTSGRDRMIIDYPAEVVREPGDYEPPPDGREFPEYAFND